MVWELERRINQWCNRWLTLGGRLILVKFVLGNNLVYWLSLGKILSYILDLIRRNNFNFLWVVNKEKTFFHLLKLQDLSRPGICGGWGMNHIFHIGKPLTTKSFLRGLFGFGMRCDIIEINYLKNKHVHEWS